MWPILQKHDRQHVTTFHHPHAYGPLQRRLKAGENTFLPTRNHSKATATIIFKGNKRLIWEKQQYTFNIFALDILKDKTKKPRSLQNSPRCYKFSLDQRPKIIRYDANEVPLQASLGEVDYVKRSHLHLIKVLYHGYGNLTTLNKEENKKYLQRSAPLKLITRNPQNTTKC